MRKTHTCPRASWIVFNVLRNGLNEKYGAIKSSSIVYLLRRTSWSYVLARLANCTMSSLNWLLGHSGGDRIPLFQTRIGNRRCAALRVTLNQRRSGAECIYALNMSLTGVTLS
jgi:hypothetical protein